jgi:cell division protein FtsL
MRNQGPRCRARWRRSDDERPGDGARAGDAPTTSGPDMLRARERRGLQQFVAGTVACALIASAAMLQIWLRTRVTEQGYRLSRLSLEQQKLQRENERLRLLAAQLESPQRIAELAGTRLGMAPPPPERVIVLVGSAVRRSGALVAAK